MIFLPLDQWWLPYCWPGLSCCIVFDRTAKGSDSTSFSSYVSGKLEVQLCFVVPLYCRPYGDRWGLSTVGISSFPHNVFLSVSAPASLWGPAEPLRRIMLEVPVMVVGPLHIDNALHLSEWWPKAREHGPIFCGGGRGSLRGGCRRWWRRRWRKRWTRRWTCRAPTVNDGQRLESMALSSVAPPPITSMELPFLPFAPTAVYCVRAI